MTLVMTCGEVATELGYVRRDGTPARHLVRTLVREGKLPPPIDPTLTVAHWRWSRKVIEQYVAGEWQPARQGTDEVA